MRSHVRRAVVFVLYQLRLLTGIIMLPLAVGVRQLGLTIPVHRVVERLGDAYERTSTNQV